MVPTPFSISFASCACLLLSALLISDAESEPRSRRSVIRPCLVWMALRARTGPLSRCGSKWWVKRVHTSLYGPCAGWERVDNVPQSWECTLQNKTPQQPNVHVLACIRLARLAVADWQQPSFCLSLCSSANASRRLILTSTLLWRSLQCRQQPTATRQLRLWSHRPTTCRARTMHVTFGWR